MAVKIVIERWVRAGYENLVWQRLRDLRSEAVRQRGYLYGENWRSLDNPRIFVVLSVWGSREHWDNWSADDYRRKVDADIAPMLRKPCSIKIYEEVGTVPNARNSPTSWARKRSRKVDTS